MAAKEQMKKARSIISKLWIAMLMIIVLGSDTRGEKDLTLEKE